MCYVLGWLQTGDVAPNTRHSEYTAGVECAETRYGTRFSH